MSLAIVRSNTILLRVTRVKEVYIHQRSDLADGAVRALLAPWREYGPQRMESRG